MSGDVWLRVIAVLVCLALILRAASAMLADTARAWCERRDDIVRWNQAQKNYSRAREMEPELTSPQTLPEKPWYVKLYEWGRW